MRAALAFAFRRTSALIVFAAGVGGLVFVVYRALRPLHFTPVAMLACGTCFPGPASVGSSTWDLAVGAVVSVVAVVAAAALYRRVSISGHPVATFRTGGASTLRSRLLHRITSRRTTGNASG